MIVEARQHLKSLSSPDNSLDLAVWSLTNNLGVGQTYNEATLGLDGCAWLGSIPLGVKCTV